MSVSTEQIERATSEFLRSNDFTAFDTGENFDILHAYIIEEWGEDGLANSQCWEISFIACKGKLKPIEGYVYVPPAFREEIARMRSDEIKARLREPEFKRLYDAIALEEYSSSGIRIPSTPCNPWKYLTAEQWAAMPATKRAEKYAREPMFKQAVEKLISEGLI